MSESESASVSETRDLALQVVIEAYRGTRLPHPVDSGEVFWDAQFRLMVALYGIAGDLLAVYRITREQGVVRQPRKLPHGTHPLTLDNPGMRALIRDAARVSAGVSAGDIASMTGRSGRAPV